MLTVPSRPEWPLGPATRPRTLAVIAALAMTVTAVVSAPAGATARGTSTKSDVVVEWNEDGTATAHDEVIGKAKLWRSADGLDVFVNVSGLRPGGVYTFWWIAVQGAGNFPTDIYVDGAGGVVAGPSGTAHAKASVPTGDAPIAGFPAIGDAEFAPLHDPLGALVRVEIAYHGQADDAGDDLDSWLADFWTGAACPPETPNPNPMQPHCPVYSAATFLP